LLPGEVVEKVVLVAIFGGAAWGASRLVPVGMWGRLAAGVLYAWNPFTYERLLLGHAAFLLSYAALPWVAGAAIRTRRGERGAAPGLVVALGVAAFASPYGGIFGTAIAVLVVAFPPRVNGERPARALSFAALAGAVLNLPWLVPALLHPGGLPSPRIGFDLFRSRADSPLGLVGSLLSLGGLWRTDLAPPGRDTAAWIPAFVLILIVACLGLAATRRRWPPGVLYGLSIAAAGGFLLALGVATPGLGRFVRWLGEHAPGGGLLRDGQKFLAPLALLMAVGFGAGVDRVVRAAREPAWARGLAVTLALLPIALAPTLAWGAGGRLATAHYPASWSRARAIMADDPAPGALLVLPWHQYIPLSWNRGHVVMEPARAFFTRDAVVSDALEVGREVVPPEDPWSALADPVVTGAAPLAPSLPALGLRYVLLLKEADWGSYASQPGPLSGLTLVLETTDLVLYRSDAPAKAPSFPMPASWPVVAGELTAGGLFVGAILLIAVRRRRGENAGLRDGSTDILTSGSDRQGEPGE
jgi:hypothetical protein